MSSVDVTCRHGSGAVRSKWLETVRSAAHDFIDSRRPSNQFNLQSLTSWKNGLSKRKFVRVSVCGVLY